MSGTVVHVRPAVERDTSAMLAITRDVWEGHDYVPYVWEEWLTDGRSYLSVAEIERTVVGLMHIAIQDDGTAWAEGIRVRDDVQARGVGGALLRDGIGWVRAAGLPRLRLSTYGANPASNRLASKAGLVEVARFRALSCNAPAVAPKVPTVRPGFPSDFDGVWNFLHRDGAGGSNHKIYSEGWTAYSLTRERVALLLATHAVLLSGEGIFDGMAIATANTKRPALRLGFLAGSLQTKTALTQSLMAHALRSGYRQVRAIIPGDGETLQALGAAGLGAESTDEMIVYEMTTLAE